MHVLDLLTELSAAVTYMINLDFMNYDVCIMKIYHLHTIIYELLAIYSLGVLFITILPLSICAILDLVYAF